MLLTTSVHLARITKSKKSRIKYPGLKRNIDLSWMEDPRKLFLNIPGNTSPSRVDYTSSIVSLPSINILVPPKLIAFPEPFLTDMLPNSSCPIKNLTLTISSA